MNDSGKLYEESGLAKHGTYKGIKYFINVGKICPCAYIEVPSVFQNLKNIDKIKRMVSSTVHGGLTYEDTLLRCGGDLVLEDTVVWGWDYGHYMDYCKLMPIPDKEFDGHRWTIDEILQDCIKAIDILMTRTYVNKNLQQFYE